MAQSPGDLEATCLALLAEGRIDEAASMVALHRAATPTGAGLGIDWAKGMPESITSQAKRMLGFDLSLFEVEASKQADIIRGIVVSLFLGEGTKPAINRIRPFIGDYNKAWDVADYCFKRAANEGHLEKYKQMRDVSDGVKLSPAKGEKCRHRKTEYKWKEMDKIPAIPCGTKCACRYVAIVGD